MNTWTITDEPHQQTKRYEATCNVPIRWGSCNAFGPKDYVGFGESVRPARAVARSSNRDSLVTLAEACDRYATSDSHVWRSDNENAIAHWLLRSKELPISVPSDVSVTIESEDGTFLAMGPR